MSNPLGDPVRQRLTDAAAGQLVADGFEVARPDTRTEPPAIAVRNGEGDDERVGVEPLTADDVTPTTIVSRLGHALERERQALFVVADEGVAETLRAVLDDPPLLVDGTDGCRTFHAGPDRIPVDTTGLRVDTGGYACLRVDELPENRSDPAFRWRETDTPVGPVASVSGVDAAAAEPDGTPTVPRLVCEVDDRVVAVLAGVESLRTPPASAFPYFYRRDPSDKQFRVRRGDDGTVVESVSGFAAMRHAGFVPIPMPLVPEHALGAGTEFPATDSSGRNPFAVDDLWDLLVVDDERVER